MLNERPASSRMHGQSLLEALIAMGVFLIAIAIGTASLRLLAANGYSNSARLIALDAAQNAATELLAEAAYDPSVVQRLGSTQWQVVPPSPPPGAPAGDAAPIVLTASLQPPNSPTTSIPAGDTEPNTRSLLIHYAVGSLQGDLPVTLRPLTVPPGSTIDTTQPIDATTPAPSW